MFCPRCDGKPRKIAGADAAKLYLKLKPYLSRVPSFGCYTPRRGKARPGDHSVWPLHSWRGPGSEPVTVTWKHPESRKEEFSFRLFCLVYGLDPVEE